MYLTDNITRSTSGTLTVSLKHSSGEIFEPKSGQFSHIFKFASNVFNSYVQNIVFPKKIL